MKKTFLLFLFVTQINFGQSNIVEINTTGSGETKEEAVQNALLSALKQSFGVFISSNTEIINDVLTKDKISELSSGNILEYNILSETQNGNYYNTLVLSKISMNTLASYTKNKVDSNEILGDVFVSNFLVKELNKENELQSIINLIEYSKKVLPSSLDYYIESNDPVSSKSVNYDFSIETKIGFNPNENYTIWKDHFNEIFENISLSEKEYLIYKRQKIQTYPVVLNSELYFLRNRESLVNLFKFSLDRFKNAFNFNISLKGIDKTIVFKDQINNSSKGLGFTYEYTKECEIVEGKLVEDSEDRYENRAVGIKYDNWFMGLPLVILPYSSRFYRELDNNNYLDSYDLSIDKNNFQEKKSIIYNYLKRDIGELYVHKPKNVKRKEWNRKEELEKKYEKKIYPKLLKYFPDKYGLGIGGPYFKVLAIQTDYIKPGYHKFNILFKLEDLKRFRGFLVTN